MKIISYDYKNQNRLGSPNDIILFGINSLMKHSNLNSIDDLHIEIKVPDDEDISDKENDMPIYITSEANVIKVGNSDPNSFCEFINFINTIISMDIIMSSNVYNNFRSRFTKLYFEAFFNGKSDVNYTLDTDDINQIFKFRHLDCAVSSSNINGKVYYKLIDINKSYTKDTWIDKLKEYHNDSNNDHTDDSKYSMLSKDLSEYVKSFYKSFDHLTNTEYRAFTTGFKNLYNKYVSDDDKYVKITIDNINNILKGFKIPYQISRKNELYCISIIDEDEE